MNVLNTEWKTVETFGGHLDYRYGGSVVDLNLKVISN
jgi:hypothetical protein